MSSNVDISRRGLLTPAGLVRTSPSQKRSKTDAEEREKIRADAHQLAHPNEAGVRRNEAESEQQRGDHAPPSIDSHNTTLQLRLPLCC